MTAGFEHLDAAHLRTAAADSDAWALFADDDEHAAELRAAAQAARREADEIDGFLPLDVDL